MLERWEEKGSKEWKSMVVEKEIAMSDKWMGMVGEKKVRETRSNDRVKENFASGSSESDYKEWMSGWRVGIK